jgi:hypothetical protein
MMEAIWQKEAYDRIVFNSIGLPPGAHNPCVIVRNDSHNINAFCLEFVQILNVAWQMFGTAARSEGPWDSEEDNFLISPLYVGDDRLV